MANAYSKDDLLEFLDHMGERGLMPASTAKALAVAVRNVFTVLTDDEQKNLAEMDTSAVIKRFMNKRARDFSPTSLKEYGRRVERAITLHDAWQADPSNFSVKTRETSPPRKSRAAASAGETIPTDSRSDVSATIIGKASGGYSSSFPIRPDWVVTVANIPANLSVAEAERLAKFVRMLAIE
jgi:hypothetical protein